MSRRPTRRACLTLAAGALALPARGHAAAPSRVACLEWTAAETLLALGLAPLAMGDVPGYPEWVAAPPLPAGVVDLGSRFEPNRELLHRLKPDLVVATQGYGLDAQTLSTIGAVHELSPFADGVSALDHAGRETERLAERIGRRNAATSLRAATDAILSRATARLAPVAGRPVVVVSIFEERSVRIYGGGLLADVLARLGLVNAWTKDIGPWGFAYVGLEKLAAIDPDTRVLMLDPMPEPTRIRLDPRTQWLQTWLSGSTYRASGTDAAVTGTVALAAALVMPAAARWLGILPLGGGLAKGLGAAPARTRFVLLTFAASATATATVVIGPLSFVGLMAPHMARLFGFRRPVPQVYAAALTGAATLAAADWIGRTAIYPWQVPAGLLAALIGAPAFAFAMRR